MNGLFSPLREQTLSQRWSIKVIRHNIYLPIFLRKEIPCIIALWERNSVALSLSLISTFSSSPSPLFQRRCFKIQSNMARWVTIYVEYDTIAIGIALWCSKPHSITDILGDHVRKRPLSQSFLPSFISNLENWIDVWCAFHQHLCLSPPLCSEFQMSPSKWSLLQFNHLFAE